MERMLNMRHIFHGNGNFSETQNTKKMQGFEEVLKEKERKLYVSKYNYSFLHWFFKHVFPRIKIIIDSLDSAFNKSRLTREITFCTQQPEFSYKQHQHM